MGFDTKYQPNRLVLVRQSTGIYIWRKLRKNGSLYWYLGTYELIGLMNFCGLKETLASGNPTVRGYG